MKNLFFVFALAALAPLASAQVFINPWESGAAQFRAFWLAQNIATCGGYCSPGPANPFGGYAGGGYPSVGYPGVGNGRVVRRVARDASAAATGAGFGYAIAGRKGAIGLGLAGLGLAELGGHLANRRNQSLDCGKRKLNRDEREACAELQQQAEAERQAAAAQAELAERQQTANLYNNMTGRPVYIFDGNNRVAKMEPGETAEFPEPSSGYRAMRHFKARNGRTVFKPAENRLEHDGSISFVVPMGEGG